MVFHLMNVIFPLKYNVDRGGVIANQLKRVQQIQATVSSDAFAAILADGSVVTWGAPTYGGDNSKVQHQLRNVQHIKA